MENYVLKEVSEAEHKRVNERLDHHDKWLGEHEDKIDRLDKSDATNTNEIKNLCQQIGSQTKAIWGLVTIVAAALIGFVFWYLENIPGR